VKFIRYTELGKGVMEYVKPNVEDALPPNDEWSLPILFGSEASAQHFFLIHHFLEVEQLEPGMQNQEDRQSDATGADDSSDGSEEEWEEEGEEEDW